MASLLMSPEATFLGFVTKVPPTDTSVICNFTIRSYQCYLLAVTGISSAVIKVEEPLEMLLRPSHPAKEHKHYLSLG